MSESYSHKRAKVKAAGKTGKTEVPIKGGRRIDAVTKERATEIERTGTSEALEKAAKRLKDSRKAQKVLQVPEKDMAKAVQAMRKVRTSGTVKNISGTKSRSVKTARTAVTGKFAKRRKTKGTGARKRPSEES